jgi:glutamate-1-semialdehyde 2,1-aminomutase
MSLTLGGLELDRLRAFRAAEEGRYAATRPHSAELARRSAETLVGGVPMQWMTDWPLPFPMFIDGAEGASLTDVDGHAYADFCLGDTGAMFGHAAPAVVAAVQRQAERGFTHMLPTPDAPEVGRLLREVFGLHAWQIALTATDANRFALRVARAITGRPRILVFNGCYHGTVEEAFVHLRDGEQRTRPGMLGQFRDVTADASVVEFNDLDALERELARGDIACVITEPVLTNSAMVLPEPGVHDGLRQLTRKAGTLLLIDETHTLSSGYGGYTRVHGLEPDIWVCGKAIAGGVPTAVWGMTRDVAERFAAALAAKEPGHSGMGTTLAGNALSLAALRANLEQVLTVENYARMEDMAERLAGGLSALIERAGLPWHIARVGARIEFVLAPRPLRNGTEAAAAHLTEVEQALHLGLLNRGVLIAPFHNMMLVSPATSESDCQAMLRASKEVLAALS